MSDMNEWVYVCACVCVYDWTDVSEQICPLCSYLKTHLKAFLNPWLQDIQIDSYTETQKCFYCQPSLTVYDDNNES